MSSDQPSQQDPHCVGGDVAAYALGALDASETKAFEAHLASCTVCRDELAAFEEVVQALPMSAPVHQAPRGLKRAVMAAVAAEPKTTPAPRRAPRRDRRLAWMNLPPRLGLAAASLATVVVFAVGALTLGGSGRSRVIDAQVIGVRGSAQVHLTDGHAELTVEHMSPPPSGLIYEVWLSHGAGNPAPTKALFSVTRSGAGDVDVPGSLAGVRAVLVTPEPAGGSKVPTHAPVIRAQLT